VYYENYGYAQEIKPLTFLSAFIIFGVIPFTKIPNDRTMKRLCTIMILLLLSVSKKTKKPCFQSDEDKEEEEDRR
jgi:hypothetical protein